jgi:hypothetical protein
VQNFKMPSILAAALIVLAMALALSGCGKNDGSTTRSLQYFGVNGFRFGDVVDNTKLVPVSPSDEDEGFDYNFKELSYSVDPDSGVLRKMLVPISASGATVEFGIDSQEPELVLRNVNDVTELFGEGKSDWQDTGLGLMYSEYVYSISKQSAVVRFVYYKETGVLKWILAASSLPYPVPVLPLAA